MNKGRITAKQQEILNFMKAQIMAKGYPPSVREICEAVSLKSTSSVHAHLETLEKNGYIRRDQAKPRAIEIMDDDFTFPMRESAREETADEIIPSESIREMVNIPIVGTVAAGQPLLAVENITDYFPVPVDMLPNAETFMLRVKGDSMINMGIYEGDQLIIERRNTARNGEVVVALVDDSATVKRFYKENGHYRLQPENDYMEPIIVEQCEILGKVIGLIRMNIV
ncbi:MAG: transcriptional repressor LexA [Butyrivibrio sp.]